MVVPHQELKNRFGPPTVVAAYVAAIVLAELGLGRAAPLHPPQWADGSPPWWVWSVSVHALGLVWAIGVSLRLRRRTWLLATLGCAVPFWALETLNRFGLHFFAYPSDGAFAVVLGLYAALAAGFTLSWRMLAP